MSDSRKNDLIRDFEERARQMPPAQWVQDMIDHYRRTGSYRPEDLRRLLGDPNKAVEVGSKESISSHFLAAADRRG